LSDAAEIVTDEDILASLQGEPSEEVAEQPSEEVQSEAEQQAAEQAVQMFKYKALGKEIEEDIDTILKRASMGYDYSSKMEDFKRQQAEWEPKIKTAQELHDKWSKYDEYAQKNPEWYSHWQDAWANRETYGQNSEGQPAQQIPESVRQTLEEQGKIIQGLQSRFETQDMHQQDEALSQEIKSVRDSYPNLDFRATDPNTGKSLEQQVIDYAIQNKIGSFKTAFRDFYHDNLVRMERERAKDEYAKNLQEQKKQGIIGVSSTPQNQRTSEVPRNATYSQLEEMAARELGLI
jgi:hypothetical protein